MAGQIPLLPFLIPMQPIHINLPIRRELVLADQRREIADDAFVLRRLIPAPPPVELPPAIRASAVQREDEYKTPPPAGA